MKNQYFDITLDYKTELKYINLNYYQKIEPLTKFRVGYYKFHNDFLVATFYFLNK